MANQDILTILKKVGAILTDDHFVLTTGRHSAVYINKDVLYAHPIEASEVGELFAKKYKDAEIQTVAAPALGGIVLSQWTAHHLSRMNGREVYGVYTEKTPEKNQVFTRGYDMFVRGKRVLVIEDLTTTGGSVQKVVKSVREAGGEVVGVCVMVNRNPKEVTADAIDAPFDCLGIMEVESYAPEECPMCKKGIPVNMSVGHGRKFVEKKL